MIGQQKQPYHCTAQMLLSSRVEAQTKTSGLSKHELTKRLNAYLDFTVTCRTNSLVYKRELTSRQEEIYELIKSLHESGLGYRRIAKRLRGMNIKTARGSVFKNNNVLAGYKEVQRATGTSERRT